MTASPNSTASSDLYPLSEPELSKPHGQEGSLRASDHQVSLQDGKGSGSGYSDSMQGQDSAGEETSTQSSALAASRMDVSREPSHKRKRDDLIESSHAPEGSMASFRQNRQPLTGITDGLGLLSESPSQWQDNGRTEDHLQTKRSKMNAGKSLHSKLKFSCKSSTLPAALWQYVFCFVPPVFLGRLLRVNHAFNSYLTTEEDPELPNPLTHSIIQPLSAEAVWVASRRRFAPGLPRPIRGMHELDMWRLLVGRKCQQCGKLEAADTPANSGNPWEAGPGDSGVRIVWPFGVRCCRLCLQNLSQKEFELYLSTCPSFLVPAIPFAFVSKDNHYIAHNLLKNQTPPPNLQMTKHFYKPSVEDVMRRFEDAKALGAATAEEWIKGLSSQGQERLEDIIRWEQWESKGGLKKVNTRYHPKPILSGAMATTLKPLQIRDESHSDPSTPQGVVSPTKHEGAGNSTIVHFPTESVHLTSPNVDLTTSQFNWNNKIQLLSSTPQAAQNTTLYPRPERNIRDVNEAKALRRSEIERRCAAMNPPLTSNLLSHMESFQAATQISQPMTEQAWRILKPRLLAQLPFAERKEKERMDHNELLAEEYRQRRQQEAQLKETKDNLDREWETFQNPVRNFLGALADDIIESRWAGGRSVTKDTSPKFAADVLLQVRQRFYADVAQQDEAAIAAGRPVIVDPLSGPPTRKLVLENMKWLFDIKVKPLTDHFQRELFLCNGCDGNYKFYGFEGVIQHYAAKHTTTLSMGNIVVHWRAEWPEHPPFNPNPSIAKSAYYKVPTPAVTHTHLNNEVAGPAPHGSFNQNSDAGPGSFPQPQDSSQYPIDTCATTYAGPRLDGHITTVNGQPFPLQEKYTGLAGYSGASNGYATNATSYIPNLASHQGQAPQNYGSSYSGQQPYAAYAQGQFAPTSTPIFHGLNGNHYGNGVPVPYQANYQNGVAASQVPTIPGPRSDLYQRQMDEMARHAKDVFINIGGIKDLPGSVRIHVVIQLTVSRFKGTFPNEPSLSMFIDGLDRNAVMRPVRSVNGLGCKMCIQSGTGAKLFTLPHLVNHFRTVHMENPQIIGYQHGPELDWKVDMIDLPDASVISKLVDASGMTELKLALIASVFQGYFPSPLPDVRSRTNPGPLPVFRRDLDTAQNGLPRPPMNRAIVGPGRLEDISSDQFHGQAYSASRPLSQGTSSEPLEPPGDDEYDPHRPALLNKLVKDESGSSPSHKAARSSILQNGQGTSAQAQVEQTTRIDDQLFNVVNEFRSQPNNKYARGPYEPTEHATRRHSPEFGLVSRAGGQMSMGSDEQNMSRHRDTFSNYEDPRDCNGEYRYTPEHASISAKRRCLSHEARSASPRETDNAADHFLSGLVSDASRMHDPRHLDHAIDRRQKATWQGVHQVDRLQKHNTEDGNYDQWSADLTSISRLENHVLAHSNPVGSAVLGNGFQKGTAERPESRTQYYREYLPSSQAQKALTSIRADQDSHARPRPQQSEVLEKEETNGSVLTRPRSNSLVYQGPHVSQHGHVSKSPHDSPAELALYRPSSPVEENRGDPIYRVRSPFSRKQREYPAKPSSYDFPEQGRYEYIHQSELREAQFQPRVEYVRVPINYEESSMRDPPARYYLSHSVEPREPQYIRYEPAYADERMEPIYERDGQFYQSSQQILKDTPPRSASSFTQDYRY